MHPIRQNLIRIITPFAVVAIIYLVGEKTGDNIYDICHLLFCSSYSFSLFLAASQPTSPPRKAPTKPPPSPTPTMAPPMLVNILSGRDLYGGRGCDSVAGVFSITPTSYHKQLVIPQKSQLPRHSRPRLREGGLRRESTAAGRRMLRRRKPPRIRRGFYIPVILALAAGIHRR